MSFPRSWKCSNNYNMAPMSSNITIKNCYHLYIKYKRTFTEIKNDFKKTNMYNIIESIKNAVKNIEELKSFINRLNSYDKNASIGKSIVNISNVADLILACEQLLDKYQTILRTRDEGEVIRALHIANKQDAKLKLQEVGYYDEVKVESGV